MIEFETAQRILVSHLATVGREMNLFGSALPNAKDRPYTHLVVSHVTEYEFGWMFFYNSREFLETGDDRYSLVGNAPFIVEKTVGRLYVTGTAHDVEHYVQEYRRGIRRRAGRRRFISKGARLRSILSFVLEGITKSWPRG